jgi:hypothetical protein
MRGGCHRIRNKTDPLRPFQQAHRFGLVRLPSTSQRSETHSNFDARAIALKDRMKQSAIAADSSVSGDHKSPGPPNSGGPADSSVSSPGLDSSTLLS